MMGAIKAGHAYQLSDGTLLRFKHRDERGEMMDGLTSCEILDVLIHRLQTLNKRPHWCGENIKAVFALQDAKKWLELRQKRIEGEK